MGHRAPSLPLRTPPLHVPHTSRRHIASISCGSVAVSVFERPSIPKSGLPHMYSSPLPRTATVCRAPQPTSRTVDDRSRASASSASTSFGCSCVRLLPWPSWPDDEEPHV